MDPFDVVVLGGGVAGLVAARDLVKGGARVCLLEGRARWGGRIATVYPEGGGPVELGAEFVHGHPPETLELLTEAGLSISSAEGCAVRATEAGLVRGEGISAAIQGPLAQIARAPHPDRTLAAWLAEQELAPGVEADLARYLQGFFAASLDRMGTVGLAREVRASFEHGDDVYRLEAGYAALVSFLVRGARQAELRQSAVVREVRWSPSGVEVVAHTSAGPSRCAARRAVVTLPLGVLQARAGQLAHVRFDPPLAEKVEALAGLDAGVARRIVLHFDVPFWTALTDQKGRPLDARHFLYAPGEPPEVFWTSAASHAGRVTAWAGGPSARPLASARLEEASLAALARALAVPCADVCARLRASYTHDWLIDPFTLGAYSYPLVGRASAPEELARPLGSVLFFAGEATHFEGELGTVAAAIATGHRAAREVLASG